MGGVEWVAHEILERAQSPDSSFHFVFDFGLRLGIWTWDLDSGLSILILTDELSLKALTT